MLFGLRKDYKQIEELEDFPYPSGVRECFSEREVEIMSAVGTKLKRDILILSKKSNMTFEELKECYKVLIDSLFLEEIIQRVDKKVEIYMDQKERKDQFVEDMKKRCLEIENLAPKYKKMVNDAKQGKKVANSAR